MSTAMFVRRHISQFSDSRLFTTRELLQYGTRNSVDLILFRMVNSGKIDRIARGVFRKVGSCKEEPTVAQVAKVKAAAFARRIFTYGTDAAVRAGLLEHLPSSEDVERGKAERNIVTYYTDGSTTSFKFGVVTIEFKRACPRKQLLIDNKVGFLLKGIWYLGVNALGERRLDWLQFNRVEKRAFLANLSLMPEWIRLLFPRRVPYRFRELSLYGPLLFEPPEVLLRQVKRLSIN